MLATIFAMILVLLTIVLTGLGPIYALYLYKQDMQD
jgi:hypothetical protein